MPVVEGDPFGEIKYERRSTAPNPRDVNLAHVRSDVDSSQIAQHHSLGIQHNQAAAGDHSHNGSGSRKVGTGLGLDVTGAKAGNTALASLIAQLQKVIDMTDHST